MNHTIPAPTTLPDWRDGRIQELEQQLAEAKVLLSEKGITVTTVERVALTVERYNELVDAETALRDRRCNAYDGNWPHLCELDRGHQGTHWSKVLGHFSTREEIFKICGCRRGECVVPPEPTK